MLIPLWLGALAALVCAFASPRSPNFVASAIVASLATVVLAVVR